ncbi:glycosyltransferase family 4 protein [Bacteroidota bacterium]
MRILQINSVANSGSTGRIAEDIGSFFQNQGHESWIAFGRGNPQSSSQLIRIGSKLNKYWHGFWTLAFDRHGYAPEFATKNLVNAIERLRPDVILLHNIHGYYLNIDVLFNYLRTSGVPVLWTLFDCWAFTGHCSYFDDISCEKWLTHCQLCPKKGNYPSSKFLDNSFRNFQDKKELFTTVPNLELICHSNWLANLVSKSFLSDLPTHVTPSAINLEVFKPTHTEIREKYKIGNSILILGCASIWSNRKGLSDFIALRKIIPVDWKMVLIGLNESEISELPSTILGLARTESIKELAAWYSTSDVFVNPTSQDNFPTTNLESLACGTPVVTYNTGGSPEAIDELTGKVVEKGNVEGLFFAIEELIALDKNVLAMNCRSRAELLFDKNIRYGDYLSIINRMLERKMGNV